MIENIRCSKKIGSRVQGGLLYAHIYTVAILISEYPYFGDWPYGDCSFISKGRRENVWKSKLDSSYNGKLTAASATSSFDYWYSTTALMFLQDLNQYLQSLPIGALPASPEKYF